MELDNSISNDEALENFLEFLSEKEFSQEDYDKALCCLKKIYDCNYRHKYSFITTLILRNYETKDKLNKICQNLRDTLNYIKDNKSNENLEKSAEKLYDHLNLELVRLNHINTVFSTINEMQEKSKDIEKDMQEIKQELKSIIKHHITILGIFSSIILAFVAGLTFTNSVLSNIDKASIYRLCFIVCLIALFITNILHYLYQFIREIVGVENKENNSYLWWELTKFSFIKKFNLGFILIICITGLLWFCFEILNKYEIKNKLYENNNTTILEEK